ncbi:MAG: mitochondrial fission ELM1 family protein [Hyphomicrobiaceae bacterium]|nr:mitochondrial fission ELM1 family protein [Hyphomicrobiaceae bacterium]
MSKHNLLQGYKCWIITDGKAGSVVQACGLADSLELDYVLKTVTPSGFNRFFSPWSMVNSKERFGQPGSKFCPPWPKFAIASGRLSIPYIRALNKFSRTECYTIILQDPKTRSNISDLIWVPQHDQRRGKNVITTLTSPHGYSSQRISELRANIPHKISALPSPRVTVMLGGINSVFKFRKKDYDRLKCSLTSMAYLGASFMVTTSRRTQLELLKAVEQATAGSPRVLWKGVGHNLYPSFLAHADFLVVTADSVNMTGEACATGRPVFVFTPSGGSAKFTRFHNALKTYGATRDLPNYMTVLDWWSYHPIDATESIAAEIQKRYTQQSEKFKYS